MNLPDRASDSGPDNPEREPFFAIAEPCESCDEPCQNRTWNIEHENWAGTQCSCSLLETPTCPDLILRIESCSFVDEVSRAIQAHREHCPVCGPTSIQVPIRPVGEEEAA